MSETKGLITIVKPLRMTDESRYVNDLPEAVSETKRVEIPFKIFLMV